MSFYYHHNLLQFFRLEKRLFVDKKGSWQQCECVCAVRVHSGVPCTLYSVCVCVYRWCS